MFNGSSYRASDSVATTPRDGMYLGRCFLTDEHEVGLLWAQYKAHPRMFCSVQDDDFTRPFPPVGLKDEVDAETRCLAHSSASMRHPRSQRAALTCNPKVA